MSNSKKAWIAVLGAFLLFAAFVLGILAYEGLRTSPISVFLFRVDTFGDLEYELRQEDAKRSKVDQVLGNIISQGYYWKSDLLGYRQSSAAYADCNAAKGFHMVGMSHVGRRSDLLAAVALYRVCIDRSNPTEDYRREVEAKIRGIESQLSRGETGGS